jgi:hypothetical protein
MFWFPIYTYHEARQPRTYAAREREAVSARLTQISVIMIDLQREAYKPSVRLQIAQLKREVAALKLKR